MFDCAQGNWVDVVTTLRKIQVKDNAALDVIVANNLAVALVNSGQLHDATDVLERMVERSPATSLTEPVIFNLVGALMATLTLGHTVRASSRQCHSQKGIAPARDSQMARGRPQSEFYTDPTDRSLAASSLRDVYLVHVLFLRPARCGECSATG